MAPSLRTPPEAFADTGAWRWLVDAKDSCRERVADCQRRRCGQRIASNFAFDRKSTLTGKRSIRRFVAAFLAALCAGPATGLELDARIKLFGTGSTLPAHDLQRRLVGTPAYDGNADLRLMLRHRAGPFTLLVDHALTWVSGDSHGFANALRPTLDQSPAGDHRRALNLTWEIDRGGRHRSWGRFDRLAAQLRQGPWALTLGRQAVSWGGGLVFQPMDLFNPFAPTTVDRDYKAGDDLLLVERLLPDSGDLQLLVVGARRVQSGGEARPGQALPPRPALGAPARPPSASELTGQAPSRMDAAAWRSRRRASVALKWHGFVREAEFELLAARHFSDRVLGLSLRLPVGPALMRTDLVATDLDGGGWRASGLVNLDASFVFARRNVYAFAEYFHNGFGVRRLPAAGEALPSPLAERLQRGEVFNRMRDYLALGGNLEWHPLFNQSLTLIGNLGDGGLLLQTSVTHERGDRQRLQIGLVAPLSGRGKEFGGAPAGEGATSGGANTLFLRWLYHF